MIPSYLQKPNQTGYIYGELIYEDATKSWVIKGEPCVVDIAKRLFPGCSGTGSGQARFQNSKRLNGDLNWLMQRYPLKIAEPERWEKSYQEGC